MGFCPAEWVDDVDVAIESINPFKYQDKFCLNKGYIYTEAMNLLPSLSSKRLVSSNIVYYFSLLKNNTIFKINISIDTFLK